MNAQSFVVYAAGALLAPGLALGDVLDFEAADIGSVPAGWTVAMTGDGGQPRWEVVRDATSPVGKKVLAQISDDRTSGRFPLALEHNVVLYKVENGRRTPLAPAGRGDDYGVEHPVPAQSWSTLAVAFGGTRFVVTFDGTPLFEVEDSTFTSAGKVGLWTKADSVTYFDGFEATAR